MVGKEAVKQQEEKLEEEADRDAEERECAKGDIDTVEHTGTVRRKFVHVVPDCILERCDAYKETVTTAAQRGLYYISPMPVAMKLSTGDPRLSILEGLLHKMT